MLNEFSITHLSNTQFSIIMFSRSFLYVKILLSAQIPKFALKKT